MTQVVWLTGKNCEDSGNRRHKSPSGCFLIEPGYALIPVGEILSLRSADEQS